MRTAKEIVSAIKAAGIVGAGGGAFPTHVKAEAKVDTIIANGAECEPLLWSDKLYMLEHADLVIEGIKNMMIATGAKQGFVAVKGHYKSVVAAVEKALPSDGSIKVHLLDNAYPQGDEVVTIYEVTGRVVPEGGLPLHVGVVVSNVTSLGQIADAVGGKPVTERNITITGEVANPCVITVPIGTSYSKLIEFAGGLTDDDCTLFDGGPMMGAIVDPEDGCAKTTSGLIALPSENIIAKMKRTSLKKMISLSKAACCQCSRCTDLCSRRMMGHEIFPHKTMRTIDYNMAEPTKHITSAYLCTQCGLCELVACDTMHLSPRQIFAEYRKQLAARGFQNPHQRKGFDVHSAFEDRKVSVPMIMKKTGLKKYYQKSMTHSGLMSVTEVRIPIWRHIGAPAEPNVKPGDQVKMGDVVAMTPEGKLGALYHASIAGQVTEVDNRWIGIGTK